MKRALQFHACAGVLLLMLGLNAPVRANPLLLELYDVPDIVAGFIDVTYDSVGDGLSADGFALTIDDGEVGPPDRPLNIKDGTFSIRATIDDNGNASAGTLNIGFTGARDTLPHLQRMAVYLGRALEDLEELVYAKEAAR